MSVAVNEELVEQLKDVGNKLLLPPSSTPELVNLLDQIFELIVSSFDNLSCSRGRCYSKAVLILQSVARLRSCVMMLDLDCDSLITKMFQLFQKHISSDHPHCVFLAMEKIMSVMVEESDSLSMELVMVLVESIRKENQNASPEAFKLGAKVVEDCSKKLRPYIMEAMTSLDCCLEDYAPILSLICETESNAVEDLVHDSPKHLANSDPTADELHSAENVQHLKTIEGCSHDPGTDLGTASKSGGKVKSHNSDEENQNSTSKEKTAQGIPHGHVKNLLVPKSEKAVPTLEDEVSKGETEEAVDLDNKKVRQATSLGGSSDKKGKPSKKDVSGGTGKKSTTGLSKKNKIRTNDTSKSQRKRASSDDDVFETPHGRKDYKEDLIGSRIKVWWPLDRKYYEGVISSFDASTKKHKVDYDDGDREVLNLRTEQWEFVGDEISNDIDLFVNNQHPQSRPNMPKREASKTVFEKETNSNNMIKGEVMLDCGDEVGDGSHQAAKMEEKVKMPEGLSETKRPRLSDGQKS